MLENLDEIDDIQTYLFNCEVLKNNLNENIWN